MPEKSQKVPKNANIGQKKRPKMQKSFKKAGFHSAFVKGISLRNKLYPKKIHLKVGHFPP